MPFSAQRLLLISAMIVSLSSGTNYVYSAYAPQLASRLHLNSKSLNIVGASGNAGVYLSGPAIGVLVDRRGPRISLFIAAICLFLGYSFLRSIYIGGEEGLFASVGVGGLALAELSSGIGSSAGLTSAVNGVSKAFSPQRRGSAIAAVVSCFGLSAFFYSTISHASFLSSSDHTASFLTILIVGCTTSMMIGLIFIRNGVQPALSSSRQGYVSIDSVASASLLNSDNHIASRTSSPSPHSHINRRSTLEIEDDDASSGDDLESAGESDHLSNGRRNRIRSRSVSKERDPALVDTDIRTLLSTTDFWLCFAFLGLCSGIGLMFINNIGTQVATFMVGSESRKVASAQAFLVSLLSICNCAGRLVGGFSSDHFTHHVSPEYRFQRIWWYVPVASLFVLSQLCAKAADGADALILPTALTGFAYGALFALSPVVCVERFGIRTFATNNGILNVSPSVFGNLLNGLFGILYDAQVDHSLHTSSPSTRSLLDRRAGGVEDHSHLCLKGKECFGRAFEATTLMACLAVVVAFTLAKRRSMHAI